MALLGNRRNKYTESCMMNGMEISGNMKQRGKLHKHALIPALLLFLLSMAPFTFGQRSMEYLTRGLVAVKTSEYVFLGWRLFATDADSVQFNLYRNDTLVNESPVSGISNFVDSSGTVNSIYYLETIYDGGSSKFSTPVTVWQEQYKTLPLQLPGPGYFPNDASVADLDGDGELEIIVKMQSSNPDNTGEIITEPVFIHAYKMNGTLLWSINLGVNIRAGAHYTQLMVYDLTGDGLAEVACKTAPGTMDGTGEYLSKGPAATDDDAISYVDANGRILAGPEYLTVFSGLTGEELSTVYYIPRRHPDTENPTSAQLDAIWGDGYGNRVDRFLACVAYFDTIPSLVMCRGYYTRTVLAAWDFDGDSLTQRWVFDSMDGYPEYEGQGAHSISVGDVDYDGKDEIMYGAMAIDDDGSPLYNTQFNHGDATHLGDLIPSHPGLEFYMPSESAGSDYDGVLNPAVHVRDAATGEVIWSKPGSGDIGRAMTADITADYPGNEFWAAGGFGVYNSNGDVITTSNFPPINFAAWWDGDLLREMLDGVTVSKWNPSEDVPLLNANGCLSNNSTKSTPNLSGDILGDWREEVVLRTADNEALRIYTTTTPTEYGIYTLLQDPQYRLALTWQNVGYNQPPHPSFFIGDGMNPDSLPIPDIKVHDPGDAPSIHITSPTDGFELGLGLDLNLIVHAIGLSDINTMIIISDSITPLDTILAPPYYISIPGLTTGAYSLVATGYDKSGEPIQSAPIDITVDEGYPHVSITSPAEGITFLPEDSLTLAANAWDTDGSIDSVSFYLNDTLLITLDMPPYSLKIESPGIGLHELVAIAYDNDGQSTMSEIRYIEVGVSYTIQESVTGFCGFTGGGSVDTDHTGYTGTGFANTNNATGVQINWAIDFPESGIYKFEWRYAAASIRPGDLYLNDTLAGNVTFVNTGDWDTWETTSINAFVYAGITNVTLEATGSDGLGNIDYLKIYSLETGETIDTVSCDSIFPPDDATLASLSISGYALEPAFDPEILNYSVVLDEGTSVVIINATPNDASATVQGSGITAVSPPSGTLEVVITARNGSTTQTYAIDYTIIISALDDLSAYGIQVYPVPASDHLNIQFETKTGIINDLSIYSIDGRKMLSTGKIHDNPVRIELPDMPNGLYFIHVNTDSNSISRLFRIDNK